MMQTSDLEGSLGFLGIADLLQLFGANGNTGVLSLKSPWSELTGYIYVDDGNPVDAELGDKNGLRTMFSFFGWVDGRFEFRESPVDRDNSLGMGRMQLILDGLRMLDDKEIPILGPGNALAGKKEKKEKKLRIPVIKGPFIDYVHIVDEEYFEDGDEFVVQGRHGSWIWVVLDGKVEIVKAIGDKRLPMMMLTAGCFIGSPASFMYENNVRGASAIARGRVQLGVVDSQRMAAEFSKISDDMTAIVSSMDRRLRRITDTYARISLGHKIPPPAVGTLRSVFPAGTPNVGLYRIRSGMAFVIKTVNKQVFTLCELGPGDVIGKIPFLAFENEPFAAGIYGSDNLDLEPLSGEKLYQEFMGLSETFRNLLSHIANALAVTTDITTAAIRAR